MQKTKAALAAATATAAVLAGIVAASPAWATTIVQSNCGTNTMCLYYHSTTYGLGAEFGSLIDIDSFNPTYSGGYQYYFKTGPNGSAGNNQNVWNNAAAGQDMMPVSWFYVYYNH